MNRKGSLSRLAVTLIEVLVASAVMSIACFGIYSLFSSGAKTSALSLWRSKCNKELRNGLRLLREDLARATYPSVVTDTGTQWPDRDSHHCTIVPGRTEAGTTAPLLSFYMCTPELNVAGETKAGEKTHCQLLIEGKNLRYIREGSQNMNKIIVGDVEYVDIFSEASSANAEKNTITVEVGTLHPIFENTRVVEKVVAKVEVEVQ